LNPLAERTCLSQVTIYGVEQAIEDRGHVNHKVRKAPSWPRSWPNLSLLSLHSHRNAWANLHMLGQPNTFGLIM
jgi:hypothetical protein